MRTEILEITPKMAAAMLCHNDGNRDIRQSSIERYARLMIAGEWQLTHQGIAFDTDGKLVDGQHRLMAIVRANVTVKMMVSRDVDRATFVALDQGVKRSAADILHVSKQVAEVCNFAARVYTHEGTPSPGDLQTMLDLLGPYIDKLHVASNSNVTFFSSAPWRLGAIVRLLYGENEDYVCNLYAKLCIGEVGDLPVAAQSIVKMRLRGKANATKKMDTISQALFVFNRRNADKRIVRFDADSAGDIVREAINIKLGK